MRIRGSTMIMIVLSIMTLSKMDWGTMRILIGLTRIRMLPVRLSQ